MGWEQRRARRSLEKAARPVTRWAATLVASGALEFGGEQELIETALKGELAPLDAAWVRHIRACYADWDDEAVAALAHSQAKVMLEEALEAVRGYFIRLSVR